MTNDTLCLFHTGFDSSCFTGHYVTGERIGDEYFNRLHSLRNDSAQEKRRGGNGATIPQAEPVVLKKGGDEGCESMHNDKRDAAKDLKKGCEGI